MRFLLFLWRFERAIDATHKALFAILDQHKVFIEGIILKPSMVTSGDTCPDQAWELSFS